MRRDTIFWIGLILSLLVPGLLVAYKEAVAETGAPVYLKLAPRDPRSLLQGDYMVLGYEIEGAMSEGAMSEGSGRWPQSGRMVLRRDAQGVGHFVRLEDRAPLAPDELLLRFRKRGTRLDLGHNSFFFQEGTAATYSVARFAELRVKPEGHGVLVALLDADLQLLGGP
jgi:uncharacterized membrane-anchored protein